MPSPCNRKSRLGVRHFWSGWTAGGVCGTIWLLCLACQPVRGAETNRFEGAYYTGTGDVEYLQLLDTARRMFAPDPEFQNLSMLYMPSWNGLVEGPTWDAWWIQNSYGTTFCALPFFQEPFVTFLQNSQDLWFSQMGDGKRVGATAPFDWVAPDGALCDAARPGWIVYKQGDGRTAIHDWGVEFTAAGLLMQSELLLISREPEAIRRYLPKLERCAAFLETRRDPTNHLFLAGPAGNLLAPSYAGWKRPDGTYGQAYLAGLSVTYIAALDRLIELEKLAGQTERARLYSERRDLARAALPLLATEEGYLIRSLDPDGTKHGVLGAAQHGYFESSPNHDAVCFRVVGDPQAERILAKMTSVPELRPHGFILPNYPSYDDMYEKPEGLWAFGTWVNGGHWSTCEARMLMAYARVGKFEEARRSMKQLLTFARAFRMDNPLVKFGSEVYQPKEPINLTYDAFGPPAALVRGLFEYIYTADGLMLLPHIPPGITEVRQQFPIRFGAKRLFLAAVGQGAISSVFMNGQPWKRHDGKTIFLPYEETPGTGTVQIVFGGAGNDAPAKWEPAKPELGAPVWKELEPSLAGMTNRLDRVQKFYGRLSEANLASGYEAAHAKLILDCAAVIARRKALLAQQKLPPLPDATAVAAEKLYVQTVVRLCDGLDALLISYSKSEDPSQKRVFALSKE